MVEVGLGEAHHVHRLPGPRQFAVGERDLDHEAVVRGLHQELAAAPGGKHHAACELAAAGDDAVRARAVEQDDLGRGKRVLRGRLHDGDVLLVEDAEVRPDHPARIPLAGRVADADDRHLGADQRTEWRVVATGGVDGGVEDVAAGLDDQEAVVGVSLVGEGVADAPAEPQAAVDPLLVAPKVGERLGDGPGGADAPEPVDPLLHHVLPGGEKRQSQHHRRQRGNDIELWFHSHLGF